jgi:hypothetical protein
MRSINRGTFSAPAFENDDAEPITKFPCGAQVRGERLGHCSGPADGFDGCCRNFYGIKSWDKHHLFTSDQSGRRRIRCRIDAELVDLGYVQDGPLNSWRLSSTPIVEGSKEDEE